MPSLTLSESDFDRALADAHTTAEPLTDDERVLFMLGAFHVHQRLDNLGEWSDE